MQNVNCLRPLFVIGTRPEAIKMAPVIRECKKRGAKVDPIACFTGQHRELLAQVADYFEIKADLNLQLMQTNQTLAALTARCLEGLDAAIDRFTPDCVVAQGDTTTVMVASLAAFYRKIPFVHVEAGLRTGDLQSPWPEELNRRVTGLTAALHCAPTKRAAGNILSEGVPSHQVHVTGNTVIDALLWTVKRERNRNVRRREMLNINRHRNLVLITGHRRENFGAGMEAICRAISTLAGMFEDVDFVYPVHPNPNVREPVFRLLGNRANVRLIEPLSYPDFVWLMDRATLILTDSGGVQEEAPSLRKPVLVMRDTTERPEAVDAGAAELVGTSEEAIIQSTVRLLSDPVEYAKRQIDRNPYGDGNAASRIVDLILSRAWSASVRNRAAA